MADIDSTASLSAFAIIIASSFVLAEAASCTTYHFHPHRPPWVTGVVDLHNSAPPKKYFSSQSASHTRGPGRQRTNVGWYLFPRHPLDSGGYRAWSSILLLDPFPMAWDGMARG